MGWRVSFAETDKILSKPKAAPFLRSLEECEDNELRITVAGAKIGDCAVGTFDGTALGRILSQCRPIESDENLAFEITFESYIIYQVRNESFCSYDPQEIRHGKFLIIFEKSKLLEYLTISTDTCRFADGSFYPAKWTHYGIYTQNHVIDVISQCEPNVLRLTRS